MASLLHMEPRTENVSLLDVLLKMGTCILGLNCSPVLFQVWVVIEGELKTRRGTAWEEGRVREGLDCFKDDKDGALLVDCWVWLEEACRLSALDSWVLKAS